MIEALAVDEEITVIFIYFSPFCTRAHVKSAVISILISSTEIDTACAFIFLLGFAKNSDLIFISHAFTPR